MSSQSPTNPYDQPPGELTFSPEDPGKPARGCLFYGCITVAILAVIGLVLTIAAIFLGYNLLNNMIRDYSSTAPVVLPQVNLPQDEQDALVKRYNDFKAAVDKGEAAELVLNADEINALINRESALKGKVYISIKDDKITGQLSVPLDWIPFGMGKGRYFNGKATLTVLLIKGELIVHATELEANGKKPDPNFMTQFERQNLAKDLANNPDNAEMISRFDSIEIKKGKVYLKARSKTQAPATETPEPEPKPEPKPNAREGDPEIKKKPDEPSKAPARDDETKAPAAA